MTRRPGLVAASLLAISALMSVHVRAVRVAQDPVAPGIPGVVAPGTRVEVLRTWDPAQGGEGPVGEPDGSLLFAQQDLNKILRIRPDGTVSDYLDNANRTTGLAFDGKGRLISAGGAPPQILVLAPTRTVLASTFAGQPLLHPNDIVIDRKGGFYFPTAPLTTSRLPRAASPRFSISPQAAPCAWLRELVPSPNGIQLSPDEKTLYVSDSAGGVVVAFDVQSDGSVSNPRNFARARADGLATDSAGRLYAAAAGVQIFSPHGEELGAIPIPTKPANLAFAGADKNVLYVVGRGAAYRIQMLARGLSSRAK